jgi:putative tricarboxylic transport membrane protein
MTSTVRRVIAATALALLAAPPTATADPYPARTVRLLCWTSAGAPLDVMMRQLGKQLGELFGRTFVVDNRPGGAGVVAMAALANQPADGYNILSTTSSMSFTMATGRVPFEPANFTVLPAIEAEPSAVAVRADSRFKALKEVMEQEGKFKSVWVPFKGGQEAGTGATRRPHRRRHHDTELGAGADPKRRYPIARHQLGAPHRVLPRRADLQGTGLRRGGGHLAGRHVKAETPRTVVDALVSAIETVKQTQEWKDVARTNLKSPVSISLDEMQRRVADEVSTYRDFLKSSGLLN